MNNYNNNFSGIPASGSPARFNKRPRYGANNNGGNGSPRFTQQNHNAYQYSTNRNNATDCYQSNQYEKSPNRNLYGNTQKRQTHNHPQQNHNQPLQNKKVSPYSHKYSALSSLSSPISAAKQNVLNLPPPQPKSAQATSATNAAQNQQHEQQATPNILDSSNYYGFNYNFFPAYNADPIAAATSATYRLADGIDQFMWQTITSTPPPKLPQQQQPPLPQQQPPPIQPPLPSSDNLNHLRPPPPIQPPPPSSGNMTLLLPPPPIPLSIIDPPSKRTTLANQKNLSNDQESAAKTIIKMKAKRKAMSTRYKLSKSWCEKDALLALKAEETNSRKLQKDIILIIRFPDPEISREIVKCYSPDIESVHFQLNFAPRYCLVHLKPSANVEKTIDNLSKIPFGTGFLSVEIKQIPHKAHSTKLNEIDPFTLYVGNLPTTIACKTLKEHFPGAARIDIGFAQRMKYTRYAFIRYQNVEQAIEAYKRMLDAEIGGRTLTIRFRRLIAASEGNKDGDAENHDDIPEELLTPTTEASEGNLTQVSQTSTENTEPNVENNSTDLPNVTEKSASESERNTGNNPIFAENNSTETNNTLTVINSTENANAVQEKSYTRLNIKLDPDDIAIRNNNITSRFNAADNNIKQEEENLALHMEFFEKPNNQNDFREESSRSEMISLPPTVVETDTMSTSSSNSLAEFLQMCQGPQTQENNIENVGPLPAKRNKVRGDVLNDAIKQEPFENNDFTREVLPVLSNDSVAQETLKQEPVDNENVNIIRSINSSAQNTSSHTNKTVSRQPDKISAANNSEDSYNDDVVPPTALFFRSDYQNMLTNTSNDCDYDEFYETRASSRLANVKTEPSDISRRKSIIQDKNIQQTAKLNRNSTIINDTILSKETSNTSSASTSNTNDDGDDLVPPQNLLGSYQPSQNVIKQEMEHDDLFSVPFYKRNQLSDINSEDICNNNDSVTSFTSQSHNTENIFEISNTNVREDNDEDVIIISDNLKRQSKVTKFSNLDLTNFFLPKQTDLVSFKDKPAFVTIPNREVSKLIDRDHLDRLYDQLDADSDSEL